MQNQGIGREIIRTAQEYAAKVDKPIVLQPDPEKGKKQH